MATFGERSALLLPVVAVVAFLAKARLAVAAGRGPRRDRPAGDRRLAGRRHPDPHGGPRGHRHVASQATDTQRFTVWRVLGGRAVRMHPWLGWGPAMTQSAYLANATEAEVTPPRASGPTRTTCSWRRS